MRNKIPALSAYGGEHSNVGTYPSVPSNLPHAGATYDIASFEDDYFSCMVHGQAVVSWGKRLHIFKHVYLARSQLP